MKITVNQLRQIIKEEVSNLEKKKLSGSQEGYIRRFREEALEDEDLGPGLSQVPEVLDAAILDFRNYLKKGASVDKAWNEVFFNLEDGVYGQIPGYDHPENPGSVYQITRR